MGINEVDFSFDNLKENGFGMLGCQGWPTQSLKYRSE